MMNFQLGACVVAGMYLLYPVMSFATETVSWLFPDLPPVFINSGPLSNVGFGDLALQNLTKKLPKFEHRFISASNSRVIYELQHDQSTCSWGIVQTEERKNGMVFSNRPIRIPAIHFIIQKDRLIDFSGYLTKDGLVDLNLIFDSKKFRGGFVSYLESSPFADEVVHFIEKSSVETSLEKTKSPEILFNLLHLKHIDFAFAAGWEVSYYNIVKYKDDSKLLDLGVSGAPVSMDSYIACSNSALGQEVIRQVNRIIDDDQQWAEMLSPAQNWIDPIDFSTILATRPQ